MATPTASPQVASTVGLKNVVIAPLTEDTDTSHTYGELQLMAGAIEATITPDNTDPDIQYADDIEFDVLYPDPELTFSTSMADVPLAIQEMIFGNQIDDNGVLVRTASDRPPYFAVGFKSEKSDGAFRYVWLYKGARQAHDGELQDQGGQDHHPPERLRGVDGHQAHPRRALSGGGRRGPERL